MIHIRKASETDRDNVAMCIAEGFEKDFSILCKDNQKVADAIALGLNMEKFYVADVDGKYKVKEPYIREVMRGIGDDTHEKQTS